MLNEPPLLSEILCLGFLKNVLFEKYSDVHCPTLLPLPPQKEKKKKKASEIEFRMKNKSSHQGKYDVQYIAD